MLILFKPWRTAIDLHDPGESWSEAFDTFQHSPYCPAEFKQIMSNMQLLHECKDGHDDHFSQHHRYQQGLPVPVEICSANCNTVDLTLQDIDDNEILQHLKSIETCYSQRTNATSTNTLDCIMHTEDGGLFTVKSSDPPYENTDINEQN